MRERKIGVSRGKDSGMYMKIKPRMYSGRRNPFVLL